MSARAVLGVCTGTHDSAAALIVNDSLVGLVEEERLNGIKHTNAYPQLSIDWLLRHAGLDPGEITDVAYNFMPAAYLQALPQTLPQLLRPATARRALARAASFARVSRRAAARITALRSRFPNATVTGTDHHYAHGLYAAAASGYDRAAVLVTDSLGETTTTSIGHWSAAGGGHYDILDRLADPASLGYAYGAVTMHLGWRRSDEEGTIMALAALGDPAHFRPVFARALRLTRAGFRLDPRLFALRVMSSRWPRLTDRFTTLTCPPRRPEDPVEQVHADLAAALQERTDQVMLHLARLARDRTGSRLLCVGGGVAMNCVAIGRIAEHAGFDEVAVPPAPGDSGTAAGAALAAHLTHNGQLATGVAGRCYLGPSHDQFQLPAAPRPGLSAHRIEIPAEHLAQQLAAGTIVGLFQGRLEAGPRALGNRSILASPLQVDVVDRLNRTVKFREPFRPFAPVVLADKAADYFRLAQPSPFMSIASAVTDLAREQIPSVVHANGTARIQTLAADDNPFLAAVLDHFAALTGVPVLINTSLNIKGKPICATPDQALDCLTDSGLDALLLGDWWVSKT